MPRKTLEQKIDEAANKKLASLLTTVDQNAIVRLDKNARAVYIGSEKADEGRLKNLKAEAEFLVSSELWKLLNETPKELAHKKMFVECESLEALRTGKSILYALDVQKNVLDIFLSYGEKK